MPIPEAKVNEIARKMGSILIDAGIKMTQSAYRDFKPVEKPFSFIQTALANAGITAPIVSLDEKYFLTE